MSYDDFVDALREEVVRIKATDDFAATVKRVNAYISESVMPALAECIAWRKDECQLGCDAEVVSLLVYKLRYVLGLKELEVRAAGCGVSVGVRGVLHWARGIVPE